MFGIALDRHNINRVGLMGVNGHRKAEVGWQVAANLTPRIARIVAPHDVPVFLHEKHFRPPRDAWRCGARRRPTSASGSGINSDFRPRLIGRQVDPPSSVRNTPAAEMAMKMRWDGWVQQNRVQAQPPSPGCHRGPDSWPRRPDSSSQFCPPWVERKARRLPRRRRPCWDRRATAPDARPA